jgi:hypothetical protein
LAELLDHNARYRETIFTVGAELARRFGRENVLREYERVILRSLSHV